MKYYIRLYSKYTGDSIVLGSKYNTRESAIEYAEKNVCSRCNRYEINNVPDEFHWINKERGFVSKEERGTALR